MRQRRKVRDRVEGRKERTSQVTSDKRTERARAHQKSDQIMKDSSPTQSPDRRKEKSANNLYSEHRTKHRYLTTQISTSTEQSQTLCIISLPGHRSHLPSPSNVPTSPPASLHLTRTTLPVSTLQISLAIRHTYPHISGPASQLLQLTTPIPAKLIQAGAMLVPCLLPQVRMWVAWCCKRVDRTFH